MKTSQTQYEILLTYMERYGDLSKPITNNPRGKVATIQHWEKLTALLNKDGGGATKTTEKWKKVWADFKNNTKKKASKINTAASGTGGGPPCRLRLTDLEERVMVFVGQEAATGMSGVIEAGLYQEEVILGSSEPPRESGRETRAVSPPITDTFVERVERWNEPGSTSQVPGPSSPVPGPSTQFPGPSSQVTDQTPTAIPGSPELINLEDVFSGSIEHQSLSHGHQSTGVREPVAQPALHGQTTPQRSERSLRPIRRRSRPSHTEQTREVFFRSDLEWRNFRINQHNDYMAIRREQNRIRRLEVETQRIFLDIASKAIGLIESLASKYL